MTQGLGRFGKLCQGFVVQLVPENFLRTYWLSAIAPGYDDPIRKAAECVVLWRRAKRPADVELARRGNRNASAQGGQKLVQRTVAATRPHSLAPLLTSAGPDWPLLRLATNFPVAPHFALDRCKLGRNEAARSAAPARAIAASGALAASTISFRGAIRLASSASPNCSKRPNTFRSIGSCQRSLRLSK